MPLLKLIFLAALSCLPARLALAGLLRGLSDLERVGASLFTSCFLFFLAGLVSFHSGGPRLLIHAAVPLLLILIGIPSTGLGGRRAMAGRAGMSGSSS